MGVNCFPLIFPTENDQSKDLINILFVLFCFVLFCFPSDGALAKKRLMSTHNLVFVIVEENGNLVGCWNCSTKKAVRLLTYSKA